MIEKLLSAPHRFSFFQAVMLLQNQRKEAAQLGYQGPPEREALRLRADTSLAFPKSDVAAIEHLKESQLYRLTVGFMGLYGTTSPLPSFYSELLIADEQEGGPLRSFFDLFNHRLLSFYYRAWTKYRPHVLFSPGGGDELSERLFALIGLGSKELKKSTGFASVRLLTFAGLLTQKPHSAQSLEGMVRSFFGLPVKVRQFVKRKILLEENQKALLGKQNCRLAENLAIGERVADSMGKFRVSVGPLDYADYKRFLPQQEGLESLKKLASFFAPDMLEFDTEVVLIGEETPRLGLRLSADSHLGWTTGFFSREAEQVAVVFN